MSRRLSRPLQRLYRCLPICIRLKISLWRGRLREYLLGPHAEAVLVGSYNGNLLVSSSDYTIGASLASKGEYERDVVEHLQSLIDGDARVLFVGTHVGSILIPIAKMAAEVTGIEANPDTFRLLKLNLVLNGIENARIHNFAAGDRNGQVEFVKDVNHSGGSRVKVEDTGGGSAYGTTETVIIPLRRLDDAIENRRFDLVVMDIEGSEYSAFRGMQEILAQCAILQVEILPGNIREVAGVDPSVFVAPLEEHFDVAYVCKRGYEQVLWPKRDFGRLVEEIFGETRFRTTFGTPGLRDVVFRKDRP